MKNKKGQTLIELALVIALISVILLGITEFARAWFTKNSLKNAVRQGARVAVVTPAPLTTNFSCTSGTNCPNDKPIINAVCCQPGVKPKPGKHVLVTIKCNGGTCGNPIDPGTTVTVEAAYNDDNFFIVGGTYFELFGIKIWPWERSLNITVDASMRYE